MTTIHFETVKMDDSEALATFLRDIPEAYWFRKDIALRRTGFKSDYRFTEMTGYVLVTNGKLATYYKVTEISALQLDAIFQGFLMAPQWSKEELLKVAGRVLNLEF